MTTKDLIDKFMQEQTIPNYSGEILIKRPGYFAVLKNGLSNEPLYSSILGKYINPATGEVVETKEN